jgi:hypothetical protein
MGDHLRVARPGQHLEAVVAVDGEETLAVVDDRRCPVGEIERSTIAAADAVHRVAVRAEYERAVDEITPRGGPAEQSG